MRVRSRPLTILSAIGTLTLAAVYGCVPASPPAPAATAAAPAIPAEKGGQEEFGPYEFVANWPQPLADAPDGI